MKDVQGYLKRLDAEITMHRQQIAMHQVEIARIEDARRVVMGIAESDAHPAHPAGEPLLVNGSHAKPVLIVRKSTEAFPEEPPPKLNKSGDRRGMNQPKHRSKKVVEWPAPKMRTTVMATLRNKGPLTTGELRAEIGLGQLNQRSPPVKALYNALGKLRKLNRIVQDDATQAYSLPQ